MEPKMESEKVHLRKFSRLRVNGTLHEKIEDSLARVQFLGDALVVWCRVKESSTGTFWEKMSGNLTTHLHN